ncbi:MAG: hypothetical protein WBD20_01640 [Pirellulaceae bacterium]
MNQNKYLASIAIACLCLSTGCMKCGILGVDRCADIPSGAIPEPAGSKLCQWQTAQATGAFADQLVLCQSDFLHNSTQLSPAATERVERLVHNGSAQQTVWTIEPSDSVQLDESRLREFVYYLDNLGAPPIDVVVARPAALGLTGPVAERAVSSLGGGARGTSNTGNARVTTARSF